MKKIIFLFFSVLCLCSCNSFNKEKSIEITQNVAEGNSDALLSELDESVFQAIGKDSLVAFSSDQTNNYSYTEIMKAIAFNLSEPYSASFWIALILGLGVVAFNIFTIVKVKRSNLDRKWLMYLLIILLNAPYIYTSPEKISNGLSIHILGFGLTFAGQYSFVKIGIPIGAFIAWYKMKKQKQKEVLENE